IAEDGLRHAIHVRQQHASLSERQLVDGADGNVVRIVLRREKLCGRGISRIEQRVGGQELGPGVSRGNQVAAAEALFKLHVKRVVPALSVVGEVRDSRELWK